MSLGNTEAIWLNGKVADSISLKDRGLAFGDGLFESMLVVGSRINMLDYHLDRVAEGSEALQLSLNLALLKAELLRFISVNNLGQGVVKIILTRGVGPRGYAPPRGSSSGNRCLLFSPSAELIPFSARAPLSSNISRLRLSRQKTLSGIKHLNRLEQVLATTSSFSQPSCDDSILLDTHGRLIETVSSNLFMFRAGELITPDLTFSGVNGTVRRLMLAEMGAELGLSVNVRRVELSHLRQAELVFCTNSVKGVRLIKNVGLWKFVAEQGERRVENLLAQGADSYRQFLKIAHWVDKRLGITD